MQRNSSSRASCMCTSLIAISLATTTYGNYKERCLEPAVAVWHRSKQCSWRSHSSFARFKTLVRMDESIVAFASSLHTDAVTKLQLLSGGGGACGPVQRSHVLTKSSVTQCVKALSSFPLVTRACTSAEVTSSVLALITVKNCGQFLEACVTFDLLQRHSLPNTKQT